MLTKQLAEEEEMTVERVFGVDLDATGRQTATDFLHIGDFNIEATGNIIVGRINLSL